MPNRRQPTNDELRQMMQGREYLAGQEVSSINPENRTVDIVFFTGIDVPRTDYWTGQKYVLRFDPKGADFSLLNNGAPVLDNHPWNVNSSAQKGKSEKAWQDGKLSKATLRFSKRASVDEIWQDVEDKIITKFSMGVSILAEEKFIENNMEVRLAKKWQPFELSIAPIPADFGTTTLSALSKTSNAVDSPPNQLGTCPEGESMPDTITGTGAQVDTEALKAQARAEERARVAQIQKLSAPHKLSAEFLNKHIDGGTSVADFGIAVLEELARISAEESRKAPTRTHHTELVRDEVDARRECMSAAIDNAFDSKIKLDHNNPFAGIGVQRIAEESVRLQYPGKNLRWKNDKTEIAMLAMQTSADFASVLESSARKQLLRQYELTPVTFKQWAKASTSPDFKTMSRSRLSEAPGFLPVGEGAQITIAAMSDSKEQYALGTYGRGISFTLQMLINDDLNAFGDLIAQFGGQAARKENAVVYAILTANANMADGTALFAGGHSNTGTGVIGNTALDAMYAAMRKQKGLDAASVLNIVPKFLLVPVAKEMTARQNLAEISVNVKTSDRNWFAGRLEPIADAELDGTSTAAWYAAADPAIYPGVEYCHLEGAEGPQIIRKENESGILGIQLYAYTHFAAKAVDFRPLFYSTGS